MENFGTIIEFSLAGFQDDKILRHWIESPVIAEIACGLKEKVAVDDPQTAILVGPT